MLKIHAIIIALNEEDFIANCIGAIYDHCSGISVITQYDRNWYGQSVEPDSTVFRGLNYPDPHGKINIVVRRHIDEAVARNGEMRAISAQAAGHVVPHASTPEGLSKHYVIPDYFLILDADEIFDAGTFPSILRYLQSCRPRVMHLHGYEYAKGWNFRVPPSTFTNVRIGFVRAGIYFKARRVQSTFHIKLAGLGKRHRIFRDLDRLILRNVTCPQSVGVFHHGALLKSAALLQQRAQNHSEKNDYACADDWHKHVEQPTEYISNESLPKNIVKGDWPQGWVNRG